MFSLPNMKAKQLRLSAHHSSNLPSLAYWGIFSVACNADRINSLKRLCESYFFNVMQPIEARFCASEILA